MGIAAAGASRATVVLSGAAGLIAGAMSMASGEFVSVHSQADTEKSDLARESAELEQNPAAEQRELAQIYVRRGLGKALAAQVAAQLMAHDALAAHARDELGIYEERRARPLQAALTSALSFALGAALPLASFALVPMPAPMFAAAGMSIAFLALLGAVAAKLGGAGIALGAWRVAFWGALAMAVTMAAGALFAAWR